ncbi:hypothetical protein M0805_002503 [Coniferiporia weirii]|nr:hypothetical protein M0805_002503 [Coniferiporia weirii]
MQASSSSGPSTSSEDPSSSGFESTSSDTLTATLATLAHLNLSGCISYDDLVLKAYGGYCDIFFGECTVQTPDPHKKKVAVKRLRIHIQGDRDFAKRLAKELKVWSKLAHQNILPLLGFLLEGPYPSLVSEWMDNGPVSQYIRNNVDCDVLRMILGVADGIFYLHYKDIVHSDIKAENILVDQFGTPLICDFGISRMLSATQSLGNSATGIKGSIRWMAPELLSFSVGEPPKTHTKSSDVWAFGMTVYELLAGKPPYSHLKLDVHVLFAIIHGELPPPIPLNSLSLRHEKFLSICEPGKCWDRLPELRPSMRQIVLYLTRCYILAEEDLRSVEMYQRKPPLSQYQVQAPSQQQSVNSRTSAPDASHVRRGPSVDSHSAGRSNGVDYNAGHHDLSLQRISPPAALPTVQARATQYVNAVPVKALYNYQASIEEEFNFHSPQYIGLVL